MAGGLSEIELGLSQLAERADSGKEDHTIEIIAHFAQGFDLEKFFQYLSDPDSSFNSPTYKEMPIIPYRSPDMW